MLSVNDLKGLLEVNRVAVIPFIVAAYINQFSFSHFPEWVATGNWFFITGAFVCVVVVSFLLSWLIFDLSAYIDFRINQKVGKQVDFVYSVSAASLISFGILGFFTPEPFSNIKITWFIASGACGLYLLDTHRKARLELENLYSKKIQRTV